MDLWNNATDQSGNRIPYFYKLDQAEELGQPDVTIVKAPCGGGAGYACSAFDNSWHTWLPNDMKLSQLTVSDPAIRDADNCGRIAHELGHKMGLMNSGTCSPSIMNGSDRGVRPDLWNKVSYEDVKMVNAVFGNHPECVAVDGQFPYEWK